MLQLIDLLSYACLFGFIGGIVACFRYEDKISKLKRAHQQELFDVRNGEYRHGWNDGRKHQMAFGTSAWSRIPTKSLSHQYLAIITPENEMPEDISEPDWEKELKLKDF